MKKVIFLPLLIACLISCVPHANTPVVTFSTLLPATKTGTTTIVPTPSPTPKFFPTLTIDKQKRFYDFLSQNGGCDLPCLWGVTPGETLAEDAFKMIGEYTLTPEFFLYDPLGDQPRYSNTVVVGHYEYLDSNLYIDVSKNGEVRGFSISTDSSENGYSVPLKHERFEKFSLLYVLEHLGMPDGIYINPPKSPRIRDAYGIYVIYDSEKLFINYYGTANEVSDGIYELCPNLDDKDIFNLRIVTADPNDSSIDLVPYTIYSFRPEKPYPVEELGLELDKNEIYNRYINQSSYCFQYDGYSDHAIFP